MCPVAALIVSAVIFESGDSIVLEFINDVPSWTIKCPFAESLTTTSDKSFNVEGINGASTRSVYEPLVATVARVGFPIKSA